MSHDWAQLTSAVLESGPLLHFRCLCREEARLLEKQETAEGIEISLDQILGEGVFSDPQEQLCMMIIFYPYVPQQLLGLRIGFRDEDREWNLISGFNRVSENPLVTLYKDELRLYK